MGQNKTDQGTIIDTNADYDAHTIHHQGLNIHIFMFIYIMASSFSIENVIPYLQMV